MSDLNMQFVREFFELHLFHVLTHWRHAPAAQRVADASALLFVEHSRPVDGEQPGLLLLPEQVHLLHRAVVEVRAWHGERFYPSVVENSSILGHVAGAEVQALAENVFGSSDFTNVLVISELPTSPGPRERSLSLLREMGVEHVLEFPTLMQEICSRISAQGQYAPSQTLETLRLMKRYNLIRYQQLEFPFAADRLPPRENLEISATFPPPDAPKEEEE